MIKITCDRCNFNELEMYLFSIQSETKPQYEEIEVTTSDGETYHYKVKEEFGKYYIVTC